MNEPQNKLFDQRVRQVLDLLPNVPTPGTAFDAGKLWERLRPELATPPIMVVPKRTGQVRWLVAASLVGIGLFLSWLWLSQPANKQVAATYPATQNKTRYVAQRVTEFPVKRIPAVEKIVSKTQIAVNQGFSKKLFTYRKSVAQLPMPVTKVLASEEIRVTNVPVTGIPALPSVATVPTLVAVQKPTAPKRRFAVVHENELKAGEEAVYSQIRSRNRDERFVRLGAGNRQTTGPDEQPPGILLPLKP